MKKIITGRNMSKLTLNAPVTQETLDRLIAAGFEITVVKYQVEKIVYPGPSWSLTQHAVWNLSTDEIVRTWNTKVEAEQHADTLNYFTTKEYK